jgi:hemerythrin-like domain-containing protein
MQARAILMMEHRLIERMIAVIESRLGRIRREEAADPHFIEGAVDFIRTYADRTHHGKEEDILFGELERRPLSDEDDAVMRELKREHVQGRRTTGALADANARYRMGDDDALQDIVDCLQKLVAMYPEHIRKEDEVFFPAARTYLTEEEDQSMLDGFREFDRQVIHEIYRAEVEELEAGS